MKKLLLFLYISMRMHHPGRVLIRLKWWFDFDWFRVHAIFWANVEITGSKWWLLRVSINWQANNEIEIYYKYTVQRLAINLARFAKGESDLTECCFFLLFGIGHLNGQNFVLNIFSLKVWYMTWMTMTVGLGIDHSTFLDLLHEFMNHDNEFSL